MTGDYMGIIYLVLMAIFGLLFTGGAIYLIVYLVRNKEKKISLGMNTLLHIYLYVVSFATLAIAVIGATIFLNATASFKFGIPFSYQTYEMNTLYLDEGIETTEPSCYVGEPTTINGTEVCFEKEKPKQNLVTGATLTISMLILFTIHRIALLFLEKKDTIMWLKQAYNFISLLIYSALSIVSIPVSIYLLVNYVYFKPEDIIRIEAPGGAIALALVSIPLWIVFLVSTLKLRKKEKK